jgi:uridylate kinase
MDQTAAALAAERDIEILVFDIADRGAMRRAVLGERVGTLVHA